MRKRSMIKLFSLIMSLVLLFSLTGCGDSQGKSDPKESEAVTVDPNQTIIDYADAESFEFALNQGEDLVGKIVQFDVLEYHPDSAVGKDLWAGEHLNFVSEEDPEADSGDVLIVKATKIVNEMGSWFILYEKVEDAVVGDDTITKDSIPEKKPLELVDSGWYFKNSSDDETFMDFCAIIHNPNEIYIANFPKVNVTVKNSEGIVLATEEQVGSFVLPGDTVTICGMLSVVTSNLTEDMDVTFDIEYSDTDTNSDETYAKTTDFEITNVSEQKGDGLKITGEITNNFSQDVDMINLSAVFRKDGKIVFMSNTYFDALAAGQTKAFEIESWGTVPEYDTVDVAAMVC